MQCMLYSMLTSGPGGTNNGILSNVIRCNIHPSFVSQKLLALSVVGSPVFAPPVCTCNFTMLLQSQYNLAIGAKVISSCYHVGDKVSHLPGCNNHSAVNVKSSAHSIVITAILFTFQVTQEPISIRGRGGYLVYCSKFFDTSAYVTIQLNDEFHNLLFFSE